MAQSSISELDRSATCHELLWEWPYCQHHPFCTFSAAVDGVLRVHKGLLALETLGSWAQSDPFLASIPQGVDETVADAEIDSNVLPCVTLRKHTFWQLVLQKLVFHPCDGILEDGWAGRLAEPCQVAFLLQFVHQIHQHLQWCQHWNKLHVSTTLFQQPLNMLHVSTTLFQQLWKGPAFSKTPSYMVWCCTTNNWPFSVLTRDKQPSRMERIVDADANHCAPSCLSWTIRNYESERHSHFVSKKLYSIYTDLTKWGCFHNWKH